MARIEREGSTPALLKETKHLLSELRLDLAAEDTSRLNIVLTRILFIVEVLEGREVNKNEHP